MAAELFDFLNSINYEKNDLLADEANVKVYQPFIINRGLSFGADTVLYANEMNRLWGAPKRAQYDFLRLSIPKKKRYNKWARADKLENMGIIQEYYGFSIDKAKAALKILTEEQIDVIKKKLYRGGKEQLTERK